MDALSSQILSLYTDDSCASMNRLPTEILIQIFAYCARSAAIAPLRLSQVCRRWKHIIDDSPSIFELIVVDDHALSYQVANTIANVYLERTRTLPFDVEVNIHSRDSLLPLLSPFLAHLTRWRSCTIAGKKEESFRFAEFWNSMDGEPKLEQLDINVLEEGEIDEIAEHANATNTGDAPQTQPGTFRPYTISLTSNLLFMDLTVSSLPQAVMLTPIRFASLFITEGSALVSLSPPELFNFLSMCPELEFFSFTGSMCEPEITSEDCERPPPIVTLPRLRSLVLHSTLCTRIILSRIHTPALVELYLEHLNVDFKFPIHNPYLPRRPPAVGYITSSLASPSPCMGVSMQTSQTTDTDPPTADWTSLFPPETFPFPSDYALEEGDSDDEGHCDFSQSPYSDHATGMGLRSLLSRSNPPLRVLEMDYADMRTKDFAWLFARAPLLSEFRIVASDMSDRVIRMLGPWTKAPYCIGTTGVCELADRCAGTGEMPQCAHSVMLPQLRSLELIHCQRLSGSAIVAALRERVRVTDARAEMDEPPSLEDVAIIGCAQVAEEHEEELWETLRERLRIH